MSIVITVNQKGARLDSVEKIISEQIRGKYPNAQISVTRKEIPDSRADRFAEAQSLVSDAKSEAEELRDELQDWYDNLPENFQAGEKGDTLQSAIDELETFIQNCEEAEGASVEFPSMY